jgi:hypothetical protein
VLRYHEDLPEAEVARLLGLPLGTVKSLAHRFGEPGPSPAIPITAPRCIGRSKPSRLMVEEIRR